MLNRHHVATWGDSGAYGATSILHEAPGGSYTLQVQFLRAVNILVRLGPRPRLCACNGSNDHPRAVQITTNDS